jgi:hypothetical protein
MYAPNDPPHSRARHVNIISTYFTICQGRNNFLAIQISFRATGRYPEGSPLAKSRKYAAAAINSVSAWKPMPLAQAAFQGLPALNSPCADAF